MATTSSLSMFTSDFKLVNFFHGSPSALSVQDKKLWLALGLFPTTVLLLVPCFPLLFELLVLLSSSAQVGESLLKILLRAHCALYLLCAAELLRAAVAVCLVKVFLRRIVPPVAVGDNVNCYGRSVGKWAIRGCVFLDNRCV